MKSTSNQVRIIGGQLRGRKLYFPNSVGLRPTPDRVRETLFNWLMISLSDAYCLDLFAGSGVLGIEALSRGALGLTTIEQNRSVYRALEANISQLKLTAVTLVCGDALDWLKKKETLPFHIVFVDPPYDSNLLEPTLALLADKLPKDALIYWESSVNTPVSLPSQITLWKQKQAGQVVYSVGKVEHKNKFTNLAGTPTRVKHAEISNNTNQLDDSES